MAKKRCDVCGKVHDLDMVIKHFAYDIFECKDCLCEDFNQYYFNKKEGLPIISRVQKKDKVKRLIDWCFG